MSEKQFDAAMVPKNARDIYYTRWDDGERDHLVYNSSDTDLKHLVSSISDGDANILNEWFCDFEMLKYPSDEYIRFSNFFMAYEYARSILLDKGLSV